MKRAAVGFKIHGMPEELKVRSPKDLAKERSDKDYDIWAREKARKLRWWHKHKERLNSRRRSAARSIEGKYKAAEAKARENKVSWGFTPDEWEQKWIDAGWVRMPGSTSIVPAFALRGAHRYQCTCMERIDLDKGWTTENTRIVFRGEELKPGSRWYKAGPET